MFNCANAGLALKVENFQNTHFYIMGDVEDKQRVYDSTMENIKNKNQSICLSLGDLLAYQPDLIGYPINILKQIIDPNHMLNYENIWGNLDEIRKEILNLRENKLYDENGPIYQDNDTIFAKQLQIPPTSLTNDRYFFILGNKEVSFLKDISNKEANFSMNESGNLVISCFWKNEPKKYIFDKESFNLIMTYLNSCHHFILINDILFIHNFQNAASLYGYSERIGWIISGHSGLYGHFIWEKRFHVYIVDLTKSTNEKIDNRMTIQFNGNQPTFQCNYNPCSHTPKKKYGGKLERFYPNYKIKFQPNFIMRSLDTPI